MAFRRLTAHMPCCGGELEAAGQGGTFAYFAPNWLRPTKNRTGYRCGFLWAGHPATSVAAASFRT